MLVVDRIVTEASLQLGQVVIAEGGEARPVDEDHAAVVVDDPDRLGDGLEDRLHRDDGLIHGGTSAARTYPTPDDFRIRR